jgi:hypothetical protein
MALHQTRRWLLSVRAAAKTTLTGWIAAIGVLVEAPQVRHGQDPTPGGAVGWIGPRAERFRERFRQVLLAVPTRDLAGGWALARDLGRPATPLLWDMMQAESSNVGRRLVMLGAAVLAGGPNEDERLFAWLDRQKPMLEERILAAMLLALGPRRQRPIAEYWSRLQGPAKSPEQILAIAVRLAAVRFPGLDGTAPASLDDDPGVAAAAAYAGATVPASLTNRLWNRNSPERHAELFWRGVLLCGARQVAEGRQVPDSLVARARELASLAGDQYAAVRTAAALFRLRTRDFRNEGARPDWRVLQIAASDVAGARASREWLGPAAQPRDEEPQRLAVSYVLSREVDEVIADRAVWSADQRIDEHVAVTLAWRLLGEDAPPAIDLPLAVPEWNFVRWATGTAMDSTATEIADPQLRTAAAIAAAGRITRPALRAVLEEALWRWGSHPGLTNWEQERLFVRDLLLVGSHPGGSKYVPHVRAEQRYRPTGMGPDDTFFDVAVALFDFLERPYGPMPAEYRLR